MITVELINFSFMIFFLIFFFYFFVIKSFLENEKQFYYVQLLIFINLIRNILTFVIKDQKVYDIFLGIDEALTYLNIFIFLQFCIEVDPLKFPTVIKRINLLISSIMIFIAFLSTYLNLQIKWFYDSYFLILVLYFNTILIKERFKHKPFSIVDNLGIWIYSVSMILSSILFYLDLRLNLLLSSISLILFILWFHYILYFQSKQAHKITQLENELDDAREEIELQNEITKKHEENLKKTNQLYESLLEISKKISSTENLHQTLDDIAHHLEKNFKIKYFVIMIINEEKKEAYFFNSNLDKKLTPEQFDFMTKGVKVFDLTQKGIHHGVYVHKKPIYLKHFKKSNYEFENQLVEILNLKSLIVFPLIYNNQVYGFFDITHADEPLILTNEEYLNLNIFIQYFSQFFRNYLSIKEIQEQKKKLEQFNREISKKNHFILEMNQVLTKILQEDNLENILSDVIKFLYKHFKIKYYTLYFYNKEKDKLVFYMTNGEELLDKEKWEIIKKNEIPVFHGKGLNSLACKKNRYVYLPNVLNRKTNCEIENKNQEIMKMKSILIFPLIVGNEILGTINISHIYEPVILNKIELTLIKIFIDQFASVLKNLLLLDEIKNQKYLLETKNIEISKRNKLILKINEAITLLNQHYDLKEVLNLMSKYLKELFDIEYFLFYRYDDKENKLIYTESNFEELYDKETILKIKKQAIALGEPGLHSSCCKRKKHIYLPKLKKSNSPVEEEIKHLLKLHSLLIFPLYFKNELLGTLDLSSLDKELNLNKIQLVLLKIFIDQFSSILKNKLLIEDLEFKQLELEKSLLKLEMRTQQLKTLNEFTKKINSTTDFNSIIKDVFDYFEKTYDLKFSWLILVDEKKKIFKSSAFSVNFYELDPVVQDFLSKVEIPINESTGTLYRTYTRKRHFYASKIFDSFQGSFWDQTIIKMLNLKWLLQMPLIVQDKVIGIISFTNYDKVVHLNLEQLRSIQYICDQIAGGLYRSYLFDEIKQEKQNVELAQKELQKLNDFTKKIIEEENFDIIIQDIFSYLKNQYELQFGWLLLIDKDKNLIRTSSFSKNIIDIPKEMQDYLTHFEAPVNSDLGTIYRTIQRKKHLYLKRIDPNYKGSKIDTELIKITKLKWVLYVPLILKHEVIGILAFTNYEKNVYLKIHEIKSIEAFCSQIVGAIYNSYLRENIKIEKEKANKLLLNILPPKVAEELKEKGYVKPRLYKNATVMFTDFVEFTKISSSMSPDELILELDRYFYQFDEIITRNHLTKLKTIGDAYMCVGGIPEDNNTHAVDICLAALEIRNLVRTINKIRIEMNLPCWDIRIGINTGEVVAGVIGKDRIAYDIWGDTVNIAQRLEQSCLPYEINISRSTYDIVKYFFRCEYRGKRAIKNRGMIDMFFLNRIHPKLSKDEHGFVPNEYFFELYNKLKHGAKFVYKHEIEKYKNLHITN